MAALDFAEVRARAEDASVRLDDRAKRLSECLTDQLEQDYPLTYERAYWLACGVTDYVPGLARDIVALTDSAGELVRLRDSQEKADSANCAEIREAAQTFVDAEHADDEALIELVSSDRDTDALTQRQAETSRLANAAFVRLEQALSVPSSSVSPSLTEKDLEANSAKNAEVRGGDDFCSADPWCGCGAGEECKRDKALREANGG